MSVLRVLVAVLAMVFAAAAPGQSGEQRGSIPPGQAQDGSKPSDGAIKGGTILPGETSGVPARAPQSTPSERVARCEELPGSLRQECLAQEERAGAGATEDPSRSKKPDLGAPR